VSRRNESPTIQLTGIKVCLLLLVGHQKRLLGIVALGDVLENGIALPDHLVVVRVVDESGDTTVGVQLAVFFGLLLLLSKVKDDLTVGTWSTAHLGTLWDLTCKTNQAKESFSGRQKHRQ
jgi:hypothetical protein